MIILFRNLFYIISLTFIVGFNKNVIGQPTKNVTVKYENISPTSITALVFGYQTAIDNYSPTYLVNNFSMNFNRNKFNFELNHSMAMSQFITDSPDQISGVGARVYDKTEMSFAVGLKAYIQDEVVNIGWKQNLFKNWRIDIPVKVLIVNGLHFGCDRTSTYFKNDDKIYPYESYSAFIGYFFGKYHNHDFKVDEKRRKALRFTKSYLDIFYSEGSGDSRVIHHSTIVPFGARLGIHVYSLKNVGFSAKVEIGVLPRNVAIDGTSMIYYGRVGFGFNLAMRKIGEPVVEI